MERVVKLMGAAAMLVAFAGHGSSWAQALLPLDVDAACREVAKGLKGESPRAALRIEGNLQSVGCKYLKWGKEYEIELSPPFRCLMRAPNLVAVWLNPSDWKAWACAEPGAPLPVGSISTAQPAPPLNVPSVGAALDEKYRRWFERHLVPVTPSPFFKRYANEEYWPDRLTRLRGPDRLTRLRGRFSGLSSPHPPSEYFSRNVWVVVSSSEASLRSSQAAGAVSRLHAELVATAPELARNTAKLIVFTHSLNDVPDSIMDEYFEAGFEVWLMSTPKFS
jgi:hypothetical protein